MKNYKKSMPNNDYRHTIFYRRVTSTTPYLQPRLERVPVELLTTYHFLTENDERGRNRIFIRLQRRATAVAPYFQRRLERVSTKLLITYRFLTGSDVSRIKIVSQTIFILLTPPFHMQSVC